MQGNAGICNGERADCEAEQKRMERTNRTKRRSGVEDGGRKAGEAEREREREGKREIPGAVGGKEIKRDERTRRTGGGCYLRRKSLFLNWTSGASSEKESLAGKK